MIGFAGLTHLGAVSSIAAAAKGFQVIGYDPDAKVCSGLSQGRLPVFEPGLGELLEENSTRITFSSEPSDLTPCGLVFISMDVPTDAAGLNDLAPLNDLIDTVATHLSPGAVLVILSQVKPGFNRDVAERIHRHADISLHHQVETLVIGTAVDRALHPERFMVGCEDSNATLPEIYDEFLSSFGCPILKMGYESAEIAKIAVNIYLASSVTVSNCLAELCASIGGEWSEVVPALRMDARIGPYAYVIPGLGISGGHLERDLATVLSLASEMGTDAGPIDVIDADCRRRQDYVLKTIHAQLDVKGSRPNIAIWGLAYKPGTESTKNSPALNLIDSIRDFPVKIYDPQAALNRKEFPNVTRAKSCLDACQGSDVLAVMTPWADFAEVDLSAVRESMAGRVIIDPFGALDQGECSDLGFLYFRLGSPDRVAVGTR